MPHAERQLEDTLICCVNKLSCWFHFGVCWSVIIKSIWWNDPGLSDSYRRDGKQKGVGLNRSLSHHLSPYCQERSNKGTWTIKPSLGNGCFAHDRHQSLFKSKSFWNNYGTVSSTEKKWKDQPGLFAQRRQAVNLQKTEKLGREKKYKNTTKYLMKQCANH